MERLALICDNASDFAETIRDFLNDDAGMPDLAAPAAASPEADAQLAESPPNMKGMKKQLAISTLAKCGGNKSRAAKQLGITRYTLDRLLK